MWSYTLAAVGILGLYLAGKQRRIGWLVGFGAQALWLAYAVVTNQYGFIVTAIAYAVVYAKNWLAWNGAHNTGSEGEGK